MRTVWVGFFTPGWDDGSIRDHVGRQRAAQCLANALCDDGVYAAAVSSTVAPRLANRQISLLEVRVRAGAPADAAADAKAAVKSAAKDIGLILWEVEAYSDPQQLAS